MLHEFADVLSVATCIHRIGTSQNCSHKVIVTKKELFVQHLAALSQPHANVTHTEPVKAHVHIGLSVINTHTFCFWKHLTSRVTIGNKTLLEVIMEVFVA